MKANTFGVVTCLWDKLMKLLKEKTKGIQEVTWQELKDLRDGNNLVKGRLYRITDYECTTTQADTQSASHQFDIVLLALSENKLAEEGWAMMNESNIYDVTFRDEVTKKCYIYMIGELSANVVDCETLLGLNVADIEREGLTINNENKTANWTEARLINLNVEGLTYNYFQNSNLSAWKVWYCLDNDSDRFAWADDGDVETITDEDFSATRDLNNDIESRGLYAWSTGDDNFPYVYTKTTNPKVGDYNYDDNGDPNSLITAVSGFGRGVIYRLIDEWNNDVAYDFKNIQFSRKLDSYGAYDPSDGEKQYVYTFDWYNDSHICEDASIVGNYSLTDDQGRIVGVVNNTIKSRILWDDSIASGQRAPQALNDIVILSEHNYEGGVFYPIMGNTFDHNCMNITGGTYCLYNKFSGGCSAVTIEAECINNTILSGAHNLTIPASTSEKCYIAGELINE